MSEETRCKRIQAVGEGECAEGGALGSLMPEEGQARTVAGVFQARGRDAGLRVRGCRATSWQASRPGEEELVIQLIPPQGKPPHSVRTWGFTPWEGAPGSVLSKGVSFFI